MSDFRSFLTLFEAGLFLLPYTIENKMEDKIITRKQAHEGKRILGSVHLARPELNK